MREQATLVRQEAPLTVRGDIPASVFPRRYRAEHLDISLHLSHSSHGSYLLIGILTSSNANERINAFEGMDAELYTAPGPFVADGDEQAAKPVLRTHIDDLGHIVFRDVPEGKYLMILHLPGYEVVIEELPIGLH